MKNDAAIHEDAKAIVSGRWDWQVPVALPLLVVLIVIELWRSNGVFELRRGDMLLQTYASVRWPLLGVWIVGYMAALCAPQSGTIIRRCLTTFSAIACTVCAYSLYVRLKPWCPVPTRIQNSGEYDEDWWRQSVVDHTYVPFIFLILGLVILIMRAMLAVPYKRPRYSLVDFGVFIALIAGIGALLRTVWQA